MVGKVAPALPGGTARPGHRGSGRNVTVVAGLIASMFAAPAVAAPSVASIPATPSVAAAKWHRCSKPYVMLVGGATAGRVVKARRISCRRATQELSRLDASRNGQVLRPSEGSNWFWSCRRTGDYETEGYYFKCTHGRKSFKAATWYMI